MLIFLDDLYFAEEKHGNRILPGDDPQRFVCSTQKKNRTHTPIKTPQSAILDTSMLFFF